MSDIQLIEKIGFENGQFMELPELPAKLRTDIETHNNWTQELQSLSKEIVAMQERFKLVQYARTGLFVDINKAASELQNSLFPPQEVQIEAPTQSDAESTDLVDSQDPQ